MPESEVPARQVGGPARPLPAKGGTGSSASRLVLSPGDRGSLWRGVWLAEALGVCSWGRRDGGGANSV